MLNSARQHLDDVAAGREITSSYTLAAGWSRLQNHPLLEANQLSSGL